jgi:RNA polymerase sigma factor (sigma-70 family)
MSHIQGSLEDMLQRIQDGQVEREQGYTFIFQQLNPYLWKVVHHTVNNLDAEQTADLVGLAWRDIWQKLGTFDHQRASLKTWSSTIAHNKAVDYLRTQRNNPTEDVALEDVLRKLEEENPIAFDISEILAVRELQHQLLSEILKLDKVDLFLYLVQRNYDVTYHDLLEVVHKAGLRDLTEKAIQNRVYRVKEKIIKSVFEHQVLD